MGVTCQIFRPTRRVSGIMSKVSASVPACFAQPRVAVGNLAEATSRSRVAPTTMSARQRRTSQPSWQAGQECVSHGTCQGATCVEQDAATLRNSSAWRSWLRTIRDYASSDGVKGAQEAAILADAMEEHGCRFLANLNAQNVQVGGCFSWGNNFDWEFKTVEFFCPVACGCGSATSNTGCPRPFGYDCDSVYSSASCITVDDQHYCKGWNAEVISVMVLHTAHDLGLLLV